MGGMRGCTRMLKSQVNIKCKARFQLKLPCVTQICGVAYMMNSFVLQRLMPQTHFSDMSSHFVMILLPKKVMKALCMLHGELYSTRETN